MTARLCVSAIQEGAIVSPSNSHGTGRKLVHPHAFRGNLTEALLPQLLQPPVSPCAAVKHCNRLRTDRSYRDAAGTALLIGADLIQEVAAYERPDGPIQILSLLIRQGENPYIGACLLCTYADSDLLRLPIL